MGTPLPHSQFSTRGLPAPGKFDAWSCQLAAVYDARLPDTANPKRFDAEVNGYLFGPISQMRCRTAGQHFARDTSKIDADGVDNFMIQIFRKGGCIAQSGKGEIIMDEGDICIFDNAQTLDSYNSDFDLLAMFVPRALLAPHLRTPDSHHLNCVKSDEPLAVLLRQHLTALHQNAPGMTAEEGELLVDPTISLIAATLNGSPGANAGGEQAVRLAVMTRIKSFIDSSLAEPGLNADQLCDAFGISRTRLYKMFAASDGIASYIRNRRLAAALAVLRDTRQVHRKIIDIAYSFGFGSEVSFIRAFRRRYGMTPSDARHGSTGTLTPGASLYDFGNAEWRDWMQLA